MMDANAAYYKDRWEEAERKLTAIRDSAVSHRGVREDVPGKRYVAVRIPLKVWTSMKGSR